MKCSAWVGVLTMFAMTAAPVVRGDLVGLWEFENSSSLTAATSGSDLVLVGADAASAGSGTTFDTGAAQLGVGSHYTVTHGIGANGGGAFVNEYTLLWDVMYPQATAGSWKTFFQTNVANVNDGELFIRPADPQGAIGVVDTGYTTNTTAADTWYRVVLSVANGSHFKVYVDGNQWLDGGSQPVDGRFSLDPVFHLLGDNDGDDAVMNLSNFAIWDSALDVAAVASLGGAGRALAVPEPCAAVMLALLALAAVASRRG